MTSSISFSSQPSNKISLSSLELNVNQLEYALEAQRYKQIQILPSNRQQYQCSLYLSNDKQNLNSGNYVYSPLGCRTGKNHSIEPLRNVIQNAANSNNNLTLRSPSKFQQYISNGKYANNLNRQTENRHTIGLIYSKQKQIVFQSPRNGQICSSPNNLHLSYKPNSPVAKIQQIVSLQNQLNQLNEKYQQMSKQTKQLSKSEKQSTMPSSKNLSANYLKSAQFSSGKSIEPNNRKQIITEQGLEYQLTQSIIFNDSNQSKTAKIIYNKHQSKIVNKEKSSPHFKSPSRKVATSKHETHRKKKPSIIQMLPPKLPTNQSYLQRFDKILLESLHKQYAVKSPFSKDKENFKFEGFKNSVSSFELELSKLHFPKKLEKEDFQLGKKLGKGQFGEVQLVRHKTTNFICAMKTIKKQQIIKDKFQGQLIREMKIQSFLDHSNITPLYGYFDDHSCIYLLVQFCPDGSFLNVLKKAHRLTEQQASPILRDVCLGLRYMHRQNIIHRDIKPENILMPFGLAKVTDFGWSVHELYGLRKTASGSPLYYPPQIVLGNQYDEKVDVWDIGMMTYQCLIGVLPFKIYNENDLKKIATDEISFPNYIDLSEQCKQFIVKALQKNPAKRFTTQQMLKHPFLRNIPESNKKFATEIGNILNQ